VDHPLLGRQRSVDLQDPRGVDDLAVGHAPLFVAEHPQRILDAPSHVERLDRGRREELDAVQAERDRADLRVAVEVVALERGLRARDAQDL
jgi:hypothetical protein